MTDPTRIPLSEVRDLAQRHDVRRLVVLAEYKDGVFG